MFCSWQAITVLRKKMHVQPYMPRVLKWNIYNYSRVDAVHYSLLLKNKKKFQEVAEAHRFQVEKHHKANCCNIVDEQTLSSLKQRKSIHICFLDKTKANSFLGMNILVAEENQLEIRNNVLITLKCNSDILFQLCRDGIYVWCVKSVAWSLFYILYEHYLKSPAVTTFSAAFYYAITSQYLMWNEQNISSLLYPTGKNSEGVKNVYEIHEMQTNKFHTSSEIMVGEKSSKKGLKRKIEYQTSGKNSKVWKHSCGDFCGCIESAYSTSCKNSKWNIFGELQHYFPNSYSNILLKRMHSKVSENTSNLKNNFSDVLEISPSVKKPEKENPNVSRSEISMNRETPEYKLASKLPPKINIVKSAASPSRSVYTFPVHSNSQKNEICTMDNTCINKSMNSNIKSPERYNKMQSSFLGFQTAAGRNLNISETALKAAEKLLAEVCFEKDEDLKQYSSTTASFENIFQSNKDRKTIKTMKQNSTEASVCDINVKNDDFSHDENIDDAITKEIFEIPFDDNETKSDYTHSPFIASDANTSNASRRRVRKSLGGRRSFKFYSNSNFSSPKQAK